MSMGLSRLTAVIDTELKLFMRDSSLIGLLAILLGLCFALTPSPEASYAILTIAGQKPIMTADTLLVASALVFAIFIFPLYTLLFGIGRKRDHEQKVSLLFAKDNGGLLAVIIGRIMTNIVKLFMISVIACCALLLMIYIEHSQLPSLSALLYFVVATVPSGLFAIVIGILLDRYLAGHYNKQLFITFSLWFAFILFAIHSPFDIFAVKLIQPGTFNGQVSIGFISAATLPLFDWQEFAPSSSLFIQGSWYILIGVFVLLLCAGLLFLHQGMNLSVKVRYKQKLVKRAAVSGNIWDDRSTSTAPAGQLKSGWIVLSHWLGLSRLSFLLMCGVFTGALIDPQQITVLIPLALAIPLTLFTGNKMAHTTCVHQIELTTNALRIPSPILFRILIMLIAIIVPLLPSMIHFNWWQLASFCFSSAAVVTWLFTAFYLWHKPMLAITVYAVIWYIFAINQPPFDLFGIHSQMSHQITTAVSLIMFSILIASHFTGKNKS